MACKSVLSFVPRGNWQDQSLLITTQFFTPLHSNGSHRHSDGQLAYDMPFEQQRNHVIDGSMFVCRAGLEVSEEHGCYVLLGDWEQDVRMALGNCRNAGGFVPGQKQQVPPQPHQLLKTNAAKKAPEQAGITGQATKKVAKQASRT